MIDILLATYNGGKFLRNQIDSILNQSYKDWILLISDDGSTDDTLKIINEYIEKYRDKIKIVDSINKNKSSLYNFWHLLKFSKSDYIMFCDQDDIWLEDKIMNAFKTMIKSEINFGKIPLLVHTDLKVIDERGILISDSLYRIQAIDPNKFSDFKQLLSQNGITGCTMLFNRELKKILSPVSENVIMHDWWIGLHASYFGKIVFLNSTDILYRQHQNNVVGAKNVRSFKYISSKLKKIKNIKSNILSTYYQSKEFIKYVNYNNCKATQNYNYLIEYSKFTECNKIFRIIKTIRFGFWKQKLFRKIAQIFLC